MSLVGARTGDTGDHVCRPEDPSDGFLWDEVSTELSVAPGIGETFAILRTVRL